MNDEGGQDLEPGSDVSASDITVGNIRELADDVIENSFLSLLDHINANAAAIWLRTRDSEEEFLTIAYNVGGRGAEIEGQVRQTLDAGLVSKAYQEAKTICHQGIFSHKEQSMDVDRELHQVTAHQIAAPFYILGTRAGAITAIQTLGGNIGPGAKWGFNDPAVGHFENWVKVMQRLFELNLRRAADS
jgi:hypothetical protein